MKISLGILWILAVGHIIWAIVELGSTSMESLITVTVLGLIGLFSMIVMTAIGIVEKLDKIINNTNNE